MKHSNFFRPKRLFHFASKKKTPHQNFPIIFFHRFHPDPGDSLDSSHYRQHEDYLILVLEKEQTTCFGIGHKISNIGTAIFLRSNMPHMCAGNNTPLCIISSAGQTPLDSHFIIRVPFLHTYSQLLCTTGASLIKLYELMSKKTFA